MEGLSEQTTDPARLHVVGLCGHSIDVVVGGATVTFTCLAPTASSSAPPPKIVPPSDTEPSHVATIIADDIDPELFAAVDLDPDADPLVIDLPQGGRISLGDLSDVLRSAKEEGRQVHLQLQEFEVADIDSG